MFNKLYRLSEKSIFEKIYYNDWHEYVTRKEVILLIDYKFYRHCHHYKVIIDNKITYMLQREYGDDVWEKEFLWFSFWEFEEIR